MSVTSFMSLTLPTVSVTLGPEWATELNEALETVDSHDHTSGKGKRITTAALNIDDDLDLQNNRLIDIYSSQYTSLGSALSGALNASSVHVVTGDLWFTNGSGVAVQITAGGSVITTPSSLETMQYDAINSDVTIGAGDPTVFLAVDTTAPRTVTLPLASAVATGRIYVVKDASLLSETNTLTLAAAGADTIDGLASQAIKSDGAALFVVGNGVDKWYIL